MELPIVSVETARAVARELSEPRDDNYVASIIERLERENPHLAEFIARYSLGQADKAAAAYGAVLTYRLLESQAEADRMSRELG